MSDLSVELKVQLSEEMSEKLAMRAYGSGVSVGAIIRQALSEFLDHRQPEARSQVSAPKEERQLEGRQLDEIKSQIEEAVAASSSWDDLHKLCGEKNLELVPKGGGLVVRLADTKVELCKASEVGFAYSRLIKRFGNGLPGHHEWLSDRILGKNRAS